MNISKGSQCKDFEWAIKLQRFTLELVGLWPKVESKREKFVTNLLVLLEFLILFFGCTVPVFHAGLKNFNDIEAVIDNLQFGLPLCMIILKFVVIFYNKKSLIPVINMIAEDWSKPKPDSEQVVMIRRSQITRTISATAYVLMVFCYMLLTSLAGFGVRFRYIANSTDLGRMLPFQSYYIFDVTKTPNYELAFAAQWIAIGIAGVCSTAVDNFLALLIFHISGQMQNLRNRFACMLDAKDFDKALAFNVEDHKRIIRSVDIVENTFTLLLLVLILFFAILVCVYGTLLVIISNQGSNLSMLRIIYVFMVIATLFLHMCVCFILGEILVNDSELIYHTICKIEWENLEPKKARNMILLMIRTKKPLYLTCGKVAPMTMPTFCSILKISASYISFLVTRIQ